MANFFAWLFVGVIVIAVIAYANPHLWEDIKEKVTEKNRGVITTSQQLTNQKTTITPSYDSIKDISQNPIDYEGRYVTVKGELLNRLAGPSIVDKDDYWIWLDRDSCQEIQRDYNYGSTYIAEGIFKEVELLTTAYAIICSKPIQ